jgi:hypothetical protein
VTKKVFYCEFCKRHGLSRPAMEKHERHCTLNPERTCRWSLLEYATLRQPATLHRMRRGLPRWVRMFAPLEERHIEKLREHALGCPACMLSAIRLSGIDRMTDFHFSTRWDYEEEVNRYREEERQYWIDDERRAIEATFL